MQAVTRPGRASGPTADARHFVSPGSQLSLQVLLSCDLMLACNKVVPNFPNTSEGIDENVTI